MEKGEDVAMHHHDQFDEGGVVHQALAATGHTTHQHPDVAQLLVLFLQFVGVF